MVGLLLWAVILALDRRTLLSTVLFCCSVSFKVSTANYAPAFLFYVFSLLIHESHSGFVSVSLGILKHAFAAVATVYVIFLPWIHSPALMGELWGKIFPFDRKVLGGQRISSFWYMLSLMFPVEERLSVGQTAGFSLCLTILHCAPACILLMLRRPGKKAFMLSLVGVSMSAFLFGFHMHEKTVLLCVFPLALMLPWFRRSFGVYTIASMLTVFSLMRYSWEMYVAYYGCLILFDLSYASAYESCTISFVPLPGSEIARHSSEPERRDPAVDKWLRKTAMVAGVVRLQIDEGLRAVHGPLRAAVVMMQAAEGVLFAFGKQDYAVNVCLVVAFGVNVALWVHVHAGMVEFVSRSPGRKLV